MLNFSDEFKNGIAKVTKIWLNFTFVDGTSLECNEDRVGFNGFTRDTSTSVGGEFTVGSAVTGEMRCSLKNYDEALSSYDFRDAVVIAWLGGYTASSEIQDIHPDDDIIADNQFTITGLTTEQLSLFEVGGTLAFGTENGAQDIEVVNIVSVSTSNDITTVIVKNTISVPVEAYISVLVGEKVNVGRYYVDEYKYDGTNINIVAYDDMSKFDVPCKESSFSFSPSTTIENLVRYAISDRVANLHLYNDELPVPDNFRIPKKPEQWETMTWHDVIAYCAQIMGCFAHIVYDTNMYYLKFEWYDMGLMLIPIWDGGTFNHADNYSGGESLNGGTFNTETTPYSDGDTFNGGTFNTETTPYSDGGDIDGGIIRNVVPYPDGVVLDGGTFNPWTEGDWADGGVFGDRDTTHVIPVPHDLSVDTDDILITGVTVTLEPSDNINAKDDTPAYKASRGEEGYIIGISGNPLIETTSIAEIVCEHIFNKINGMRFRVLSASIVENPSIDAGDTAYVNGRYDVVYPCFISHVTYTVNSTTSISCDAESGKQNLKPRFTGSQKTEALIQRIYGKAVSDIETAMNTVFSSYASSMGLYTFSQPSSSGTIYIYGNHASLAASDIRWRFSAGSLSVSTDYGQTWNAALSADGVAVLNRLYAEGINADYITAGSLKVTKNGQTILDANVDAGEVAIGGFDVDYRSMRYNKTSIEDAVEGVYLGPDGLAIGDFRVYPSWNRTAGNTFGKVMFGNVTVEYTWSDDTERSLDFYADTLQFFTLDSIYLNVGNDYHIISMINESAMQIASTGDIYIRANGGYGNVFIIGHLQTQEAN